MDNQIIICNLVNNEPQKIINIDPFRIVKYIVTGLHPERHLN